MDLEAGLASLPPSLHSFIHALNKPIYQVTHATVNN